MELDRTCFCFWWNWPDFFWSYWTRESKFLFLRQIRQSGKILAICQDFGNVARFWQSGKIHVGICTCIRQLGKILAIWQDFGNQARFWQLDKILAIWQLIYSKYFAQYCYLTRQLRSTNSHHRVPNWEKDYWFLWSLDDNWEKMVWNNVRYMWGMDDYGCQSPIFHNSWQHNFLWSSAWLIWWKHFIIFCLKKK